MPSKKTYHHGDLKNALIQSGVKILAKEGVAGLSLRKVAKKAGVSHAAPYAHFHDKQALIAAISADGLRRLYEQMSLVVDAYPNKPAKQLTEGAKAYLHFAQEHPDQFRIMFSGVIESEKDHPDYVEMSIKSYQRVIRIVEACQAQGVLRSESAEALGVALWSVVHGLTMLLIEGQLSQSLTDQIRAEELLIAALNQFSLKPLS
jgi:AcrR family transcriptional regulator